MRFVTRFRYCFALVVLSACAGDDGSSSSLDADSGDDTSASDVEADAEPDGNAVDADVSGDVEDDAPDLGDAQNDSDTAGDTAVDAAETTDTGADNTETPDIDVDLDADAGEPPAARVLLNELNCEGADFIELYNAGTAAAALDGWVVNDDVSADSGWVLPSGTTLEPGQWVVWYRDEDAALVGFPFGIKCGDGEDTIRLFDADAVEVDAWEMTTLVQAGAVHGRLPDGGLWGVAAATPGAANVALEPPATDAWFDPTVLRRIEIVIPELSVENLAVAPRTWTPATLELPEEEIGPLEIGIRIKGQLGSFRTLDGKSAFRIDLNRYVAGQTLYGLDELTLNNMVQDPSVIHEFAAYSLFRAMEVAAPRVTWVQVSVNGVDYGLYLSVEGLNGPMLARWYEATTHLYEGAYGQDLFVGDVDGLEVDEGSELDRADVGTLANLFETVGIEGFYAATEGLVNWDQVVRMLATEVWIGHWDGYGPYRNNYYFHFDGAGVLSILPWGTDQTFSWYLGALQGEGLVFQACMAADECREAYAGALRDVGDLVESLDLVDVVADQAAFLREAFIADTRREYDLNTHDAVLAETLDFLANRTASVETELDCYFGDNPDPDADGFLCASDCAPDDGDVYPGAFDVCGDGIDQDCNGYADDDFSCPDCVETTIAEGTYLFCTTARTYDQALAHCAANGALPLQIESEDENRAVWDAAQTVRSQWWWIALSDRAEEGVYRTTDGEIATFFAWADGEPNNSGGDENCVHFYDGERWNDIYCDATMGVICELVD